jgi:nicotinate-nucleotide adenylyltransferase
MRLGIFGGTFDPPHFGHLLLAEQCREQCRLDEVRFVPAGVPPHKVAGAAAPAAARAEMVELAIAGHPAFRLDRRELSRASACYTVDTLAELAAENRGSATADELVFLMGADSLADFPTWREPARILELAELAIVNRGGSPAPDLRPIEALGNLARIHVVTIPGVDFSSRDLRARVRSGKSVRYMTPAAVACYIETHHLYANG